MIFGNSREKKSKFQALKVVPVNEATFSMRPQLISFVDTPYEKGSPKEGTERPLYSGMGCATPRERFISDNALGYATPRERYISDNSNVNPLESVESQTMRVLARAPLVVSEENIDKLVRQVSQEPEQEPEHLKLPLTKRDAFSALQIMSNVKRFAKKLMVLNQRKNIQLHQSQFQFINDQGADDPEAIGTLEYVSLSHFYRNIKSADLSCIDRIKLQVNQFFRACKRTTICKLRARVIEQIPLINPDSQKKYLWDLLLGMVKIYLIIMIPVQLSFDGNIIFGYENLQTIACCCLIYLDTILESNQGYYQDGQLVKGRRTSGSIHYLEQISLISLSLQCFQLTLDWPQINLLSLLFFFHIYTLQELLKKLEDSYFLNKYWVSVYRIIKLVLFILFFGHLFACMWYKVGRLSETYYPEDNWIVLSQHQNESNWQSWYVESIYFTVVTMVSVGYGDITPINQIEKIFGVFFILFASLQISYTMSTVSSIVSELNTQDQLIKQKIRVITKYMNRKHITRLTQEQVREYLYYFLQQQNEQDIQEEGEIIKCLSLQLQQTITKSSNSHILLSAPIFTNNFSIEFIMALSMVMKQESVYPENELDPANFKDYNGSLLIFIETGCVEEYASRKGQLKKILPLRSLYEGQFIGTLEFFSTHRSSLVYKSKGFTKLVVLQKTDFMNQLKEFPDDREKYQQMSDKINILEDRKDLLMECASCLNRYHDHEHCPLIHYVPDREKIIKRSCFNSENKRATWVRGDNRYSSLKDNEHLSESIELWREDNNDYCNRYPEEDDLGEYRRPQSRQSAKPVTPSRKSSTNKRSTEDDKSQTSFRKAYGEQTIIITKRTHAESVDHAYSEFLKPVKSIRRTDTVNVPEKPNGFDPRQSIYISEAEQELEQSNMASRADLKEEFQNTKTQQDIAAEDDQQAQNDGLQEQDINQNEGSSRNRVTSDQQNPQKVNQNNLSIEEQGEKQGARPFRSFRANKQQTVLVKIGALNQFKKPLQQENNHFDDLHYWYARLRKKNENRSRWRQVLTNKDYKDMELFYGRLKLLSENVLHEGTFDLMREYKVESYHRLEIYMIQNNIHQALRPEKFKNLQVQQSMDGLKYLPVNQSMDLLWTKQNTQKSYRKESDRTNRSGQRPNDLWALSRYLMYPYDFLKKYRVMAQQNEEDLLRSPIRRGRKRIKKGGSLRQVSPMKRASQFFT